MWPYQKKGVLPIEQHKKMEDIIKSGLLAILFITMVITASILNKDIAKTQEEKVLVLEEKNDDTAVLANKKDIHTPM